MIQRRLAWTLHKADTKINEVFHIKKKKQNKTTELTKFPLSHDYQEAQIMVKIQLWQLCWSLYL